MGKRVGRLIVNDDFKAIFEAKARDGLELKPLKIKQVGSKLEKIYMFVMQPFVKPPRRIRWRCMACANRCEIKCEVEPAIVTNNECLITKSGTNEHGDAPKWVFVLPKNALRWPKSG
jgi:hypothetical protein